MFIILNHHDQEKVHGQYMIIDMNRYETYERYTVKSGRFKYHLYAYNRAYEIGDIVYIKGDITAYRPQTVSFGFNSKTYFLSYQIYGKIDVEEITFIKHKFHLNAYRDKLIEKTESLEKAEYITAFIFGEKIKDDEITKTYNEFNILYLFTVSGMHIYVLLLMIKKLMFICNIQIKNQQIIILSIYIIISFLNKFSFSVMRLLIIYILRLINKKYSLGIPHLDLICITFLCLLFLNIGHLYHQGFLMTFIILIAIELLHPFTQKYQGYIQKLMMSVIVFLVILPFYPNIYIFQLLMMPILIYCVTLILYPLSIFSLISKNFNHLFSFAMDKFEDIVLYLANFQTYSYLPKFGLYISIMYYLCLIWICLSKHLISAGKRIILTSAIIMLSLMFQSSKNKESITFLDVGQGDTTIIQSNGCKMVIDSFQGSYSYLKHHGFYQIDYLLLTHSDDDHVREAKDILKHINVKQLVLSKYDQNYQEYHQKALYVNAKDQISCGDIKIDVLGPLKQYHEDNNNSIVLQFRFNNQIFLFTGDIEKDAEEDLIHMYQHRLKSDVIKVPHHGSKTSSTVDFLNYVNPAYAIMSLKTPNAYGFPSPEVIDKYLERSCIIYRTDVHGTITYHAKRRKEKWHLYLSI